MPRAFWLLCWLSWCGDVTAYVFFCGRMVFHFDLLLLAGDTAIVLPIPIHKLACTTHTVANPIFSHRPPLRMLKHAEYEPILEMCVDWLALSWNCRLTNCTTVDWLIYRRFCIHTLCYLFIMYLSMYMYVFVYVCVIVGWLMNLCGLHYPS